jgi:hypothetical protein
MAGPMSNAGPPVLVRMRERDRRELRREALRRVEAGEARRLDVSAVLRDALDAWRRQKHSARLASGGHG